MEVGEHPRHLSLRVDITWDGITGRGSRVTVLKDVEVVILCGAA